MRAKMKSLVGTVGILESLHVLLPSLLSGIMIIMGEE